MTPAINTVMLGELADFGRPLLESKDVDPVYPVMRSLFKQMRLDDEARHWFTLLYGAYYSLPSAMAAFRARPLRRWGLAPDFPVSAERRGLRGIRRLTANINATVEAMGQATIEEWATAGWGSDHEKNYRRFFTRAKRIPGNGRTTAFKWAEMLKKVHRLPLAAPDMRLTASSGPKRGLQELFSTMEQNVVVLNALAVRLRFELLPSLGLIVEDWEELETVLCNYHSFTLGRYYVGHDIDEMQGKVLKAQDAGWLDVRDAIALYEARADALPAEYLGERNGWTGVRKHLLWETGKM